MKPGYKTTEFWLTMVAQMISLLVITGVIPQADTGMLNEAAAKVAAAVVAAMTLCRYIHSRALVKTAGMLLIVLMPVFAQAETPAGPAGSAKCLCSPCTCPNCPCQAQKTCLFGCNRGQDNSQIVALLTQLVNQNAQLIALLQAHGYQIEQL